MTEVSFSGFQTQKEETFFTAATDKITQMLVGRLLQFYRGENLEVESEVKWARHFRKLGKALQIMERKRTVFSKISTAVEPLSLYLKSLFVSFVALNLGLRLCEHHFESVQPAQRKHQRHQNIWSSEKKRNSNGGKAIARPDPTTEHGPSLDDQRWHEYFVAAVWGDPRRRNQRAQKS